MDQMLTSTYFKDLFSLFIRAGTRESHSILEIFLWVVKYDSVKAENHYNTPKKMPFLSIMGYFWLVI